MQRYYSFPGISHKNRPVTGYHIRYFRFLCLNNKLHYNFLFAFLHCVFSSPFTPLHLASQKTDDLDVGYIESVVESGVLNITLRLVFFLL